MEARYSLYLDCIRFLAAVLVVLAHFVQHGVLNETLSLYVPELGREAVMIFFVLSGYVIAYTTDVKKPSLSQYAIARASRIYSVALPLLFLSFIFVYAYSIFNDETHYQLSKAYLYIPLHGLFLGELWNISERPPGLTPYWSLSYEVWYYIFFASIYYFSGIRRVVIASIVFLILGHKLWLLLPVWLSGVALYKYQNRVNINVTVARLGWLLSILSFVLYKSFDFDLLFRTYGNVIWPFDNLKLGSADRYLSDYVISMMVLLNFLCAMKAKFTCLLKYSDLIRACATYTFTLYLVHALVMTIWAKFYTHNPDSLVDIAVLTMLIGFSTYCAGLLTEHRKHFFVIAISRIYNRTLGRFKLDVLNPHLEKG